MAKAKTNNKAKPRKATSKNTFKQDVESRDRVKIGDVHGVQCEIDEVRGASEIRLVGDKYTVRTSGEFGRAGRKSQRTEEGVKVPVYADGRGVYIAPECGDYGLALSKETLAALNEAVQAHESS